RRGMIGLTSRVKVVRLSMVSARSVVGIWPRQKLEASGDCIDPARKAPRGRKNDAPMRCVGDVDRALQHVARQVFALREILQSRVDVAGIDHDGLTAGL